MLRPHSPSRQAPRRGVAVVEFAVVFGFVLVPMMLGLWEMGRAIHVQQIVANAAREGARLAAQGRTVNQNGTPTEIKAQIDPATNTTDLPNVKAAVYQSLIGGGLTGLRWDDVTVQFVFLSDTTSNTDPVQGIKLQRFSVRVSVNYDDKVRWVNLGIVNPSTIAYTADWRMMVDDPFEVNTDIPTW